MLNAPPEQRIADLENAKQQLLSKKSELDRKIASLDSRISAKMTQNR
jgi:hypothetical protein